MHWILVVLRLLAGWLGGSLGERPQLLPVPLASPAVSVRGIGRRGVAFSAVWMSFCPTLERFCGPPGYPLAPRARGDGGGGGWPPLILLGPPGSSFFPGV